MVILRILDASSEGRLKLDIRKVWEGANLLSCQLYEAWRTQLTRGKHAFPPDRLAIMSRRQDRRALQNDVASLMYSGLKVQRAVHLLRRNRVANGFRSNLSVREMYISYICQCGAGCRRVGSDQMVQAVGCPQKKFEGS